MANLLPQRIVREGTSCTGSERVEEAADEGTLNCAAGSSAADGAPKTGPFRAVR